MIFPFRWIRDWWKSYQRRIDQRLLWPVIKDKAVDIGMARYAFIQHMDMDPAYNNMTEEEKVEYVNKLV